MTTKCRQFAMECARDAFNADGSQDGDSAEFMESLMCTAGEFENASESEFEVGSDTENQFEEPDFQEEAGELDSFDMESYMAERERIEKATGATPCVKLADHYMGEGGRFLEEWDSVLEKLENQDGALTDAIEVIGWYLFQLSVKLRRAINGKLEGDLDFMEDVFGSTKVVLVGADRSLKSWQLVSERLPADKKDAVDPVISVLKNLIHEIEAEVPEARSFKRPGLDD